MSAGSRQLRGLARSRPVLTFIPNIQGSFGWTPQPSKNGRRSTAQWSVVLPVLRLVGSCNRSEQEKEDEARETVIKEMRETQKCSKAAIYALQRSDLKTAKAKLDQARVLTAGRAVLIVVAGSESGEED
jgi:hypothetical protein